MKQIYEAKFWVLKADNGTFLGLTKEFLDSIGIVWNMMHAPIVKLETGKLFLNLESANTLMSLRSPITADIVKWNAYIFNVPNELNEDTYLVEIR